MAMMTVYHGGYQPIDQPEIRKERNYDVVMNMNLKIKEFKEMSEEWLDFIIECRSGKSHDYDIVIGAMADDKIYNYISDYMDGTITREQFWVLTKFKYPTHQIVFCSNEALKCLRYRGYEEAYE